MPNPWNYDNNDDKVTYIINIITVQLYSKVRIIACAQIVVGF